MLLNFVGRAQGDLVVLLILFAEVVSYFAISPCAVSYSPLLQPWMWLTLSLSSFRVLWVVWLLVFPYRNTHIYLCISKFYCFTLCLSIFELKLLFFRI